MGGAESSFIVVASWVSSSLRSPRLHLPPSRERSRSFTVCVTSVLSGGSCLGRELCFQEEIRLCNLTVGVRCDELQDLPTGFAPTSADPLSPSSSRPDPNPRRRESTPIAVLNDHNRIYSRLRPSSTALVWMMTSRCKTSHSLEAFVRLAPSDSQTGAKATAGRWDESVKPGIFFEPKRVFSFVGFETLDVYWHVLREIEWRPCQSWDRDIRMLVF
ncbi:hypothetical protein C7M84_015162 [Penaeus vannamei]|uniref:Uncharacterized protein n=1 Tax=Penaeus vannamei TaxID=6689 RepID=A0A3R7NU46_PENVA|nr:hypothetical protein C7M84_015162 [Penaeus vannamei]